MKRSDALAPLSRDHHQALAVALVLRRASEEGLAEAARRFAGYWTEHGERHFDVEERLLLTALPPDSPGWREACARVVLEHGDLRERGRAVVEGRGGLEAAQELGRRLPDHIRFEERTLFPLLEERLAPDALAELGRAVLRAEGDDGAGA